MSFGSRSLDPNKSQTEFVNIRTIIVTPVQKTYVKTFRCWDCGKLLGKYKGRMATDAIEGDLEEFDAYFETLCDKCNILFRLML